MIVANGFSTDSVHSPAPWSAGACGYIVYDSAGGKIADCLTAYAGAGQQAGANARLIAAAPDMLAALEEAREAVAEFHKYSEAMRKFGRGSDWGPYPGAGPDTTLFRIDSAIAKAKGE